MKVTYTEEAVADVVEALTYLNERNPTAAAKLDAEITRSVERLAAGEFDGPVSRLRSGAIMRSWGVPPFRIYYQRNSDERSCCASIIRLGDPSRADSAPLSYLRFEESLLHHGPLRRVVLICGEQVGQR